MQTIIFDFDGTIADTFQIFLRIVNEVPQLFGVRKIAQNEVNKLRMLSSQEVLKYMGISRWKILPFLVYYRRQQAKYHRDVKLFPQVLSVLRHIKKTNKCQFLILSSNSRQHIIETLKKENCGIFDQVYTDDSLFHKDEAIKKIAEALKQPLSQILYIGDEVRDCDACMRSNIPFLAVSWGFNSAVVLKSHGAQEIAVTPAQLQKHIEAFCHSATKSKSWLLAEQAKKD